MRIPISNDQAYMVVDTTKRTDSVIVILRATDATPIFWSQDRSDLDSNTDAGGNPSAGMALLNTDNPLVLPGARMIVWARANAPTKIECQVVSIQLGVNQVQPQGVNIPGPARPRVPQERGTIPVPGFLTAWSKKGGFQ